ncbi:putative MFS family arabinose efflux permease [Actinokineospora baliensis]|uniref:MFS transporter n=1 Tax=Actinokineospora baliensis TaxID=547056 RepID=UPI00195A7C01|nr:MFS transporter [Actinokineospora baliensis]MBM7773145.1 putative MFS family arabinose efflux permease [Actinokineospora baliensis]
MQSDWAPFWRTVAVMTVAGLVIVGQLYAVIPLLQAFAADWGTTVGAATATTTLFGIPYASGFLLTGPLADRFGRRTVITAGLSVMTVATVLVGLSDSLAVGGVLRAVQGLGAAAFSPAALAYLTERIEPRRRPSALACLITSFLAAAVIGQLLAQALSGLGSWRFVFYGNAVLLLVLTVALRQVMAPDTAGSRLTLRGSFKAMGTLVAKPALTVLYVATLPVLGGFVGVYTALQVLAPEDLVGGSHELFLLRASALPAMVLIPFITGWLSRFRATRRTALALFVAAAILAVLAALGLPSVPVLGALLLVYVAAITLISPGLTELVGSMAGAARATGIALYTFALLMGASLGPQVVVLLRSQGLAVVLVVLGIAQAVAGVLVLFADRLIGRT